MTRSPARDAQLADALALHRQGALVEANDAYQRILAADPREIEAIHGLALIAIDVGRPAEAVPLLARCVVKKPDTPLYHISLGVALLAKGDTEDAAAHLLDTTNRWPEIAEPYMHLARALGALGRWSTAVDIMNTCVQRFPNRADVWSARGNAQRRAGRLKVSEESFRRAFELSPYDADILNNLGVILRARGNLTEAVSYYRRALALAPHNATTHTNLGNALSEMKQAIDAELHLREAIKLAPASSDARCALAIHLTADERPGEAIRLFRHILARAPKNIDAWTNLGVATLATGDTTEAERCYHHAIALDPQNVEAHYNLAWTLLLTGRWAEGWQAYEWRWRLGNFSSRRRDFAAPLWDGSPLRDDTLLLHAEQGLGDTIQFVRYAALAKKLCARVVVECPAVLVRLLQDANVADEIIAAGDPLPDFIAQAPLMSLPRIFATTPVNVPHPDTYISASANIATHLRLPDAQGRPKIGLVWAGSPDNKIDRRRTMPAALLTEITDAIDADFVSLQVGARADEVAALPSGKIVFDCNGVVKDFADTAAVVSQLDLVIGVDTAVMHLAAAMGKPTWMLLPFMPDYRWLLDRVDSPWYDSLRLFRQQRQGDWPGVTARVFKALTTWQPLRV